MSATRLIARAPAWSRTALPRCRSFSSSSRAPQIPSERPVPSLTVMPKGIQRAWRGAGEQSSKATDAMADRSLADSNTEAETKRVNQGREPAPSEAQRARADRKSAVLLPHGRPSNAASVHEHRVIHFDHNEFVAVVNGGIVYTVVLPKEGGKQKRQRTVVSYARLRDACTCSACVDGNTRQKSQRSSSSLGAQEWGVLPETAIRQTRVNGEDGLRVTWPHDAHESFYPFLWLTEHLGQGALRARARSKEIMRPVTWSGDELFTSPSPTLELSTIQSSASTRHGALLQLQKFGYLKISGVPTAETSDASCALRTDVAPLFGEIRNTFYGSTWDVKSLKKSRNVAYTDVDLGLHMDLLYFQNPPRFQLLHCLRNRVHGGQSYFVDSFHAAERLQREDPAAFRLLTTAPIAFHYDNDGYHYCYSHPTIELVPGTTTGEIRAVNYSPPFQRWQPDPSPLRREFLGADQALEHDVAVYQALQRFEEILDEEQGRVEYTLKEGECVVFDNRRVLHARRRFWDKDGQGEGTGPTRWLKGCYIDGDAVWNALRYADRRVVQGEVALAPGWDELL